MSDLATNYETDQQLVERYLAGNEEALSELIQRYLQAIYNFAFRYAGNADDAEDIVQDTFVKVWRYIKRYDPNKKFSVWLFTIAKNTALDWLKKKRPVAFSTLSDPAEDFNFEDQLADDSSIEADLDERYTSERVAQEIDKLASDYRTVLAMRMSNGLTFQEIAEVTGKPIDTIKSQYRRAVALLVKALAPIQQ